MSGIFGFILILIVIVLIIGLSLIGGILKLLFGFGRKRTYQQQNPHENRRDSQPSSDTPIQKTKKVFDKDEGEYVDFEEIKED
ncbi:MAG: DUF4834 family protein [Bacteroidaceae bacterium]